MGSTVPSERQIAANRRNARNSTGPRSSAAKKRTSQNAYRHGLTLSLMSSAAFAKQADELASKIAGESPDTFTLEYARDAAHAELDLARARRAKVAAIRRISAYGALNPADRVRSLTTRLLKRALKGKEPPDLPEWTDPRATMPTEEPQRTNEAVRRALPELRQLDRYECRAASRRDRAIRQLAKYNSTR
jgi:hypothetical protein